ncbi:unnamed protein product [Rotaria sordida]|uniref:Uncharacterized protein n=1 Tax=Rotaria sordida TaxID=392033 RepID=A0A819KSA1_9BILA|nr:unnamed protein product [Rotaria sordida]CAF3954001.1 unnamed protein product [Rotaria sordida]
MHTRYIPDNPERWPSRAGIPSWTQNPTWLPPASVPPVAPIAQPHSSGGNILLIPNSWANTITPMPNVPGYPAGYTPFLVPAQPPVPPPPPPQYFPYSGGAPGDFGQNYLR